jgi:hypothetical protein
MASTAEDGGCRHVLRVWVPPLTARGAGPQLTDFGGSHVKFGQGLRIARGVWSVARRECGPGDWHGWRHLEPAIIRDLHSTHLQLTSNEY